ncbi:hypothetical protein [Candidatus Nitrosocosmicus arcticus]|nr:hypothetical protein [Candidatus Nitrosocosmicus arcticus]
MPDRNNQKKIAKITVDLVWHDAVMAPIVECTDRYKGNIDIIYIV